MLSFYLKAIRGDFQVFTDIVRVEYHVDAVHVNFGVRERSIGNDDWNKKVSE